MHFYGNMQGNRGETTREGSMSSGIRAHVRGWNAGVRVEGRAYGAQGEDVQDGFKVYMTGGSNGHGREVLIGTVFESAQGPYFVPADATLDDDSMSDEERKLGLDSFAPEDRDYGRAQLGI